MLFCNILIIYVIRNFNKVSKTPSQGALDDAGSIPVFLYRSTEILSAQRIEQCHNDVCSGDIHFGDGDQHQGDESCGGYRHLLCFPHPVELVAHLPHVLHSRRQEDICRISWPHHIPAGLFWWLHVPAQSNAVCHPYLPQGL